MNRKVLVIAVALMAVAMLAVPISAVYATTPTPVVATNSTNLLLVVETTIKETKSGIIITQVTAPSIWEGAISGESESVARYIYHKPEGMEPAKHSNFVITFEEATVTVGTITRTGGLVIESTSNPAYPFGLWTVVEATGDLAGLHGQGTNDFDSFTFPIMTFSYTGNLHFDP